MARPSKVQALAAKRAASSRRGTRSNGYGHTDEPVSGTDDESYDSGHATRGYQFRERKKVDYSLAAPPGEPLRNGFGQKVPSRSSRGGREKANRMYELQGLEPLPPMPLPGPGSNRRGKQGWEGLPTTMTGKDYDKFFGPEKGDSSDEDIPASRKAGATGPALFGGVSAPGLIGAGGLGGGNALGGGGADLGAHRDGMGRMKGTDALADIDPLGVNMQVDFNSVGGLDHHIQQLKEMVSLPLLYPEVFQRFKVTPPRGVLFHGPPGTGKTLVARALAASCSSSGQQISFFMRKGADCLSKWVGEAERQLRLLFEEARNCQPSIIFFDEIDGLAPVRSSKQDQIHASIVSTLLALMDGMDGRGQVVVIGATNRPDSVDPALRRPGRFDREFYFPLPNREARKAIINIQTKEWEPPLDDTFKDRLAEVTKGYGGADLRALCTEAALNAIQRRYPQIYQTTERLELKPETIKVDAKDFMMSVNKVVPSSARSSSSAAAPLAEHLKPLLESTVATTIQALEKAMPPATKRNPLEEALWEDEGGSAKDGGFDKEMLLQSFAQLRVHRPRLIIHGKRGMGQTFVGSALLHHLEGYHVQSLDVASMMADSATSPEAVIIQMFTEAKRNKPSVFYIPGLSQWANNVSESVRSTVKSLLDGLSPSDPVTLLAVSDGPFRELPRDIRSWFGYLRDNRVEIFTPGLDNRRVYFEAVLQYATRPPNEFPDALPKKKRVLEELPIAAPRAPREPTAAELSQQAADDARLLEHLKYRLGPVLGELKKKFPRFKRDVWQEYNLYDLTNQFEWHREKNKVIVALRYEPDSHLLRRLKANSPEVNGHNGGYLSSQNISRGVSADIVVRVQPPAGEMSSSQALPSNGVHAVNGINGEIDVSMTNGEGANGLLQGEEEVGLSQEAAAATSPTLTGLAAAMTGEYSTSNPPPANTNDVPSYLTGFTRDEDGFFQRNLHIWTVSLERMQKRLYYNGYLTVSDFIEDIGRIVSNAIEAQEVDEERLTRAHQLHNLAVILLDQYVDVEFRNSCDKMAERMIRREEEARVEEQKLRIETEEAAKRQRMASGELKQARVHPNTRAGAIERKRTRSSSDGGALNDSLMQDSEESQAKKSKVDSLEMNVDPDETIVLNQGPDAAEPSLESTTSTEIKAAIPPHLLANEFIQTSVTSPIIHPSISPAPQAAPVPAYPPFIVDRRLLDRLHGQLLSETSTFNVEQLEQLRAALFDAIWQKRKEWNRDSLLKDMQEILSEISEEVEATNNEEREEEEGNQ
jgi:SpoVK/Ycf46/Vps4 family AAA+-type ATPase